MFRVAVPVFLIVTAWEELVVLTATEPNPSDVGVTVPWAVPVAEPATVSVKVTDPDWPLAHARITTWWVPAVMLMLVLMLLVAPAWYTEVPSTSMRHRVIGLFAVAKAETKTGELTVALFAGVETFTVTRAEAPPQAVKIRDRTIPRGFHRITRLLLQNWAMCSGGDFSPGVAHLRTRLGDYVLWP
jgi:hypothetical protein